MKNTALAAPLLLAALFAAPGTLAQDSQTDYQNADRYDIDLFGATGPALTSLDATARRASAPATPNDVDFDTGNGRFPSGNRLGFALSASPYWLGDRNMTLSQYRDETGAFERILARSQLSGGLAWISSNDTHAWRIAAAAQTQLLDAQDHRYDRQAFECLNDAWNRTQRRQHQSLAQELAQAFAEDEDADLEALQQQGLKDIQSGDFETARRLCRDKSAQRLLGQPSWIVGVGVGWRSAQGAFDRVSYDGVSLWTNYRQPVTASGRFALFALARADFDRRIDLDNAAPFPRVGDAVEFGGGGALQYTKFRLDLAATHNRHDFEDITPDDRFMRYSATADIKLLKGVWLEGTVGYNDRSLFNDGLFGGAKLLFNWGDLLPWF